MHVALVGAGDLGRVIGVRLAALAGLDLSFVTRSGGALGRVAVERVGRPGDGLGLPDVVALREPPAHADALVVTVRSEQVDALLGAPWLFSGEAPVFFLTPLLPLALERVKRKLGARLSVAMPNAMAYRREGVTRYWLLPRLAPMRVEATKGPPPEALGRLVDALGRAGFNARFEHGAEEMNAATTVAALPLYMLPACGPGALADILADGELSSLAFRALAETRKLARHVGRPAPGASPLLGLVRPWQLRALVKHGPAKGAEVAAFWQEHFGHKLAAQHRAMAHEVLAIAQRLGVLLPNFAALTARLPPGLAGGAHAARPMHRNAPLALALLSLLAPRAARADGPASPMRWVDTGGVPFPASVKSVVITRDDQPLSRAPRGDAPRRGSALLGVSLPVFGVRSGGVGCPSRWLLVGPQAWLCQNQASLSSGEPIAAGGWPPGPTDGLPYRYYFVGRSGAQGYARVEFADDASPERELEPGFALAIVEERTKNGQPYGRSRRGLWVPMRDLLPARATTFRGERVEGDKLDVAFTYLEKTPVYPKPEPNVKPVGAPIGRLRPLHVLEESGRGERVFYRIGEGEWVKAADVRRPLKAPPPADALPGEKWVDVELATQTLVAYEGTRPVYATIVSTGRGAQGADTATPRGVHRVWVKLLSSTMDNLEDENAASHYAIEDVPYVQFFAKSVGFHGTFWHDGFGRVRSHGCVNLSPVDARWLFEFGGPRLPSGWTGVLPTEFEPGLLVRVR